jgi:hypothetical protein
VFDFVLYASSSASAHVTRPGWVEQHRLLTGAGLHLQDEHSWHLNVSTDLIADEENNGTLFGHIFFYKAGQSHCSRYFLTP